MGHGSLRRYPERRSEEKALGDANRNIDSNRAGGSSPKNPFRPKAHTLQEIRLKRELSRFRFYCWGKTLALTGASVECLDLVLAFIHHRRRRLLKRSSHLSRLFVGRRQSRSNPAACGRPIASSDEEGGGRWLRPSSSTRPQTLSPVKPMRRFWGPLAAVLRSTRCVDAK